MIRVGDRVAVYQADSMMDSKESSMVNRKMEKRHEGRVDKFNFEGKAVYVVNDAMMQAGWYHVKQCRKMRV